MSRYLVKGAGRANRYGRPAHRNTTARRQPKKAYIHPSRFIQAAQPRTETQYTPEHSFIDFALHPIIQNNVAAMGYTSPSPIQDKTIPAGLAGKDVVGIANTGTGKTAAFAIPLLQRLMTEPNTKAIILAPTRELAQQIEEQCRTIAKGSGLAGALLIGGLAMGPQLRELKRNPRIIIGSKITWSASRSA
jgi:ATP-dependent RNA helicase RhlE